MKKTKTIEYDQCEFCDSDDDCCIKCSGCKKDICFDCSDSKTKKYSHGYSFGGSRDGYYCSDCEKNAPVDDLHDQYRRLDYLRISAQDYQKSVIERAAVIEARILELQDGK